MQEIAPNEKVVLFGIANRKLSTGIAGSNFRQHERCTQLHGHKERHASNPLVDSSKRRIASYLLLKGIQVCARDSRDQIQIRMETNGQASLQFLSGEDQVNDSHSANPSE